MAHRAGRRLRVLLREEYARRHRQIGWRYVPGVLVYCLIVAALIVWLAWTTGASSAWFAAGAGVGLAPFFLWTSLRSDEAERLDRAAFAEEWVEDELAKLESDGWKAHHNVSFDKVDVDHVVIGPGGVVVVETKWSSHDLTSGDAIAKRVIDRYGRQLEDCCRKIDAVLRQNGSDATTRRTLIAAAGPHRPDRPVRAGNGIRIVPVDELRSFVAGLSPQLSAKQADAAHSALAEFERRRNEHRLASA